MTKMQIIKSYACLEMQKCYSRLRECLCKVAPNMLPIFDKAKTFGSKIHLTY